MPVTKTVPHTAPPWVAALSGSPDGPLITDSSGNLGIAVVLDNMDGREGAPSVMEARANARLITAAPQMLAALKAVMGLGAIPSTQPEYRLVTNAINAATGTPS